MGPIWRSFTYVALRYRPTDGLSEEQQHVIDLVLQGRSVFVTGAAGAGKSFLLKKLHQV